MNNKEIEQYKFNDPEIDSITDFDYWARGELINRNITKQSYLKIEQIRKLALKLKGVERQVLKDIIECI